jgi:hypothetical protein
MTISKTNETWLVIAAWAKTEIEKAHVEMEQLIRYPGSDDFTRGRIAMLRDLLRLPDGEKKPTIPESPTY